MALLKSCINGLFVRLSVSQEDEIQWLSVCLFAYLLAGLSSSLSISICLSNSNLSPSPSLSLSLSLSVCLSVLKMKLLCVCVW